MVEDDARASATTGGTSPHRKLNDATRKLATVARRLATQHRSKLEELKAGRQDWHAEDFVWEALLGAFSTMGKAHGVELVRNPQLLDRDRRADQEGRQRTGRYDLVAPTG